MDPDKIYCHLSEELKKIGYSSEKITISDSFSEIVGLENKLKLKSEYSRIESSMNIGDELRRKIGGNAGSYLAIHRIRESRVDVMGDPNKFIPKHAYIIRSLKHADEVKHLREVYGNSFWQISTHLPEQVRNRDLKKKHGDDGIKLLKRDYSGGNLGQDVRDTFPIGDVFIDGSNPPITKKEIKRFIEMVFGYQFHTPDTEEYGMFHAFASSLQSSSMSRQVGAAILDNSGNLISTGTNEVPKAGGGIYQTNDKKDEREFQKGEDANQIKKYEILEDVFERLKTEKWLSKEYNRKKSKELAKMALDSELLKNMRFMDLTEYGREVHAEMDALVSAARINESVKNCIMYCTTFPCHICAKHIIAAGISKLVFIEPYPKSYANVLFSDSISLEDAKVPKNKVHFKPYFGISPARYIDLFKMLPRKDKNTGKRLDWSPPKARPRFSKIEYVDEESLNLVEFSKLMKENHLKYRTAPNT